jgi:hypothetical protein
MPIVSKQIDLDELKDLRSEMSIDDLACHFSVGRMTIIRRLKKLDLVKSTGGRPVRYLTYDGETKSLLAWSQDERCMTKMQLYKLNNLRLVYDAGKYKFVLP